MLYTYEYQRAIGLLTVYVCWDGDFVEAFLYEVSPAQAIKLLSKLRK